MLWHVTCTNILSVNIYGIKGGAVYGILNETVYFNGLVFHSGTTIHINDKSASRLHKIKPSEYLIVSVALQYHTIKAFIRKSQIRFLNKREMFGKNCRFC